VGHPKFGLYQSADNMPFEEPGKLEEGARLIAGQAKLGCDLNQERAYEKAVFREEALGLIESVRHKVEENIIETETGSVLRCTISNGIAQKGCQLMTLAGLFKEADEALYMAKQSGCNRAIFRGQR